MKKNFLVFTVIILLIITSIPSAYAANHIRLYNDAANLTYFQEEDKILFSAVLNLAGDGNTISDLILDTNPSNNIRLSDFVCVKYSEGTGEQIELTHSYKNGTINMSGIELTTGTYYFLFTYEILSTNTDIATMMLSVRDCNVFIQTSAYDEISRAILYFTAILTNPQSCVINDIIMTSDDHLIAGIPYEIKYEITPTEARNNIIWSIIDAGDTGAIIMQNILYTVGVGNITVQGKAPGGNFDGSDLIKEFKLYVDPVSNPICMNMVIGINADDHIPFGEEIEFTALAASVKANPIYGDYLYVPDAWIVHSQEAIRGKLYNQTGSFDTKLLSCGEHEMIVEYQTLRYNGKTWVDAGNPYDIKIPFSIYAEYPQTKDDAHVAIYVLLIVMCAAIFVIIKTRKNREI